MDRRSNCGCALEIIASFQRLNESFHGCHLDVNTKECQNGCSATVWNILQISGCQYCAENTILQIVTKPPSVKKSLCVCQRKRKEHVKLNNKCHNKPVNFSLCQKLSASPAHNLGIQSLFTNSEAQLYSVLSSALNFSLSTNLLFELHCRANFAVNNLPELPTTKLWQYLRLTHQQKNTQTTLVIGEKKTSPPWCASHLETLQYELRCVAFRDSAFHSLDVQRFSVHSTILTFS